MALERANWERLAEKVTERRTQLRMTQGEVQGAGGPSVATMRLIEGALQTTYRPVILARLEAALRWKAGSVRAVLAGHDPTAIDAEASRRVGRDPTNSRPRRTIDALAEEIKEILDDSSIPEVDRFAIAEMLMEEWDREDAQTRQQRQHRARTAVEMWKRAKGTA